MFLSVKEDQTGLFTLDPPNLKRSRLVTFGRYFDKIYVSKIILISKPQPTPVTSYLSSSFFEDVIFRRNVDKPQQVTLAPSGKINIRLHLRGLAKYRFSLYLIILFSLIKLTHEEQNKACMLQVVPKSSACGTLIRQYHVSLEAVVLKPTFSLILVRIEKLLLGCH